MEAIQTIATVILGPPIVLMLVYLYCISPIIIILLLAFTVAGIAMLIIGAIEDIINAVKRGDKIMNKTVIVIVVMIMNAYHMWYRIGQTLTETVFTEELWVYHTFAVGALVFMGLSVCYWCFNKLFNKDN